MNKGAKIWKNEVTIHFFCEKVTMILRILEDINF